jgi:hypothetical protein
MKPNEKQLKLIKEIKNQVYFWESTNDINSPTHRTDIENEMDAFYYNHVFDKEEYKEEDCIEVAELLKKLYLIVRRQ